MIIINGVELPETKEEFTFVELSEGLGEVITYLFQRGLALPSNQRLDVALEFTNWFIKHWRTVNQLSPIQVSKQDSKCNRDTYQIYFNNGPAIIEIKVPELSRDQRQIDLSYKLLRIIKKCGYTLAK